ncbi:MAG: hypothetical protein IH937_03340 [Acidobacteria bacterium]|nr:hypothetical protein [Acidobacteriota bacterium]
MSISSDQKIKALEAQVAALQDTVEVIYDVLKSIEKTIDGSKRKKSKKTVELVQAANAGIRL